MYSALVVQYFDVCYMCVLSLHIMRDLGSFFHGGAFGAEHVPYSPPWEFVFSAARAMLILGGFRAGINLYGLLTSIYS